MPRAKDLGEQAPPKSFPNTTPPPGGPDMSTWLLNSATESKVALGRIESTLIAMQAQLNKLDGQLGNVEKEIQGHGKWMHTLKVFAGGMTLIVGWIFVNAVWPWLKAKLGIAPSP